VAPRRRAPSSRWPGELYLQRRRRHRPSAARTN
jgi:hypothetical protein